MRGMWIQGSNSQSALFWSIIVLVLVGLLAVPAAAEEMLPDRVRVNAVYNASTPDYDVLNFSSIQKAADAVRDGGTATVAAGTYGEHLTICKAVSLVADEGAVIDAMGWGTGILIDADDVSIEGFTVTGTTTYGIVGKWHSRATVKNNIVTVVSDETTTERPVGIYLDGGTGHIICGSTVAVESNVAVSTGIVVLDAMDTLISENRVSVLGVYTDEAPGTILAAASGASWGTNPRKDGLNALEDGKYISSSGIVADGNSIEVDGNTVEVFAECLGEDGGQREAYPVGINAMGADLVRVANNKISVTGNATGYAYGDGIWAGTSQAVIEGNTITSTVFAGTAAPWGIALFNAPEGHAVNNNVTITIYVDGIDGIDNAHGIFATKSDEAQVLNNSVIYTAWLGFADISASNAGLEGVLVNNCSRSEVAGNDVAVTVFALTVGDGTGYAPVELGTSRFHPDVHDDLAIAGYLWWSGAVGIRVNVSDDVCVADNEVAVEVLLESPDVAGEPLLIADTEDPGIDEVQTYYSIESTGIQVYGRGITVDRNTVGVDVTCPGDEDNNTLYEAYPIGIHAHGADWLTVTDNEVAVTGTSGDYAYADGICVGDHIGTLIEGNTFDVVTSGKTAEPWGIAMQYVPKGRIIENNVTVTVFADNTDEAYGLHGTYGILARASDKAQVLDNTVVYNARIGNLGVNTVRADLKGIYVAECSQSQVAGNDVDVTSTIIAGTDELVLGSEDSAIASGVYKNLTGESVQGWAETVGIEVLESDEAWITKNGVRLSVLLTSTEVGGNVTSILGGAHAAGLVIADTTDAVAEGNAINVSFRAEGGATAIDDGMSEAFAGLISEVFGILLYNTPNAALSANDIGVGSSQTIFDYAIVDSRDGYGLLDSLDALLASSKEDALALAPEGNNNGTAYARGFASSVAAGIYADAEGGCITGNAVDVDVSSVIHGKATHYISAADVETVAPGSVEGLGIIGPSGEEATISDNEVRVFSQIYAESIAFESASNPGVADAWGESQLNAASLGIVGRAGENDITENTVTAVAYGFSGIMAADMVPDSTVFAYSTVSTNAAGIMVPGQSETGWNSIAGNDVTIVTGIWQGSGATGVSGTFESIATGTANSMGIIAPASGIYDNRVDVLALVDNVTAVAEEVSTLEAVGRVTSVAIAEGIVTECGVVKGNTVSAEGVATGTVIAETEALLEDARGFIEVYSAGIGITDYGRSTMTENTIEGKGDAGIYATVEGYRPEFIGAGGGMGLGIQTSGGTVMYNNIEGTLLGDYFWDDDDERTPTHAAYNWWGDASGPSGYGPGTGSAIYGVIYYSDPMTWEPWLTRPYQDVLDSKKPYFGIELRPDDGLVQGWNTLSVPIALEHSAWHSIVEMGEGLNYSAAYTWDPTIQRWAQVMANTPINPLDAVHVKMNEPARLPIAVSPEITSPPVKYLRAGWNLIGPAYAFDAEYLEWDEMKVDKALVSVEKTPAGLTGYTIALSPSINPEAWSYTVGANKVPTMATGYGYWVYMENPDSLAGFSQTPLPLPDASCLNAI